MVGNHDSTSTGLIVLGMHRSGTSTLAGALRLCGAWLGEDQELTEPNFENPKGFWERRDIRVICDRLLRAAGADWWKVASFEESAIPHSIIEEQRRAFRRVITELETHNVWAIKEPRLCLLFKILRSIVPKPVCIHVYRNPLDVAQSLRARNGFGVVEGLALWEMYNLEALQASSGLPRLLVSYELLVTQPKETLGALLVDLASLGVKDLVMPAAHDVEKFITPSLRHQSSGTSEAIDFLRLSQQELWSRLKSGEAMHAEAPSKLSSVARQYLRDLESRKGSVDQLLAKAKKSDADAKRLASSLQAHKTKIGTLKARLAELRVAKEAQAREFASLEAKLTRELARMEARLTAVYASHSWRLTAPLRAVSRLAKSASRKGRNAFRLLRWLATGQFTRAAEALQPHYRRHVASRIKLLIPHRARQSVTRKLMARYSYGGTKFVRPRFYQELQKILEEDYSPSFATALRKSEDQLTQIVARLQRLTERPLVSIVMPTYNRAPIIHGSIETALEQEYPYWELLVCDDGSTDDTETVVTSFFDHRIRYLKLSKQGAAAARNAGLESARGSIVAYLDTDNFWHPAFLSTIVVGLLENPGRSSIYTDYIDFQVDQHGRRKAKSFRQLPFNHERLLKKPYIDLNAFAHRRELYDCFGGFDERLKRRQDYDLMLKYTWLRDPLHVSCLTTLYQRNDSLTQITREQRGDRSSPSIIDKSIDGYFKNGVPLVGRRLLEKVTILSSDLCTNDSFRALSLAEALSAEYDVQLISFRFFKEDVFRPFQGIAPGFDVVDIPVNPFPGFFGSMQEAQAAIRGDVIYVLQPHLASLGSALLTNFLRATSIILEINRLETGTSLPEKGSKHTESGFDAAGMGSGESLKPHSNLWSRLMHTLAREMPVLVTHNHLIDQEFGHRCLYMRNVSNEQIYDPAAYDRNDIRTKLGFTSEDRVILLDAPTRNHGNINEIEILEHLGDPRYRLLLAGSPPTPYQRQLIQHYGERIHVLPPQDREAMARTTCAADLFILWLDPNVPASHYQMPYTAVNAFAMGLPVIANDVSDFGLLAEQGYLYNVPFGDWERVTNVVHDIFDNPDAAWKKREASRRLFLRQFSYAAARSNFRLAASRALACPRVTLTAAEAFAKRFNDHFRNTTETDRDFIPVQQRANRRRVAAQEVQGYGESDEDEFIFIVDVTQVDQLLHCGAGDVTVVMPTVDTKKGLETARILVKRAGMRVTVIVVEDTLRQGFVRTLNDAVQRLNVAFLVYLTEDAFPGIDWLKAAHEALERSGKGLLAFNDGALRGRVAAFGMLRMQWAKRLYGGPILFPGYCAAHKAKNELTLIARTMNEFIYDPTATMVALDAAKMFGGEGADEGKPTADEYLFRKRFHGNFDSRFRPRDIASYKEDFLNPQKFERDRVKRYKHGDDAIQHLDIKTIRQVSWQDRNGIAVIMPCINPATGLATARLLMQRAGIGARIYVVEDTLRRGFITTLNDTAAQLDVKYVVYVAEDAFPGEDWLKTAHARMEETGKGLLAFNCGKWQGRVAAFGMVRKQWVQRLYGPGVILHPAYKAHKADNELTVVARVLQQFVYEPDSILIEIDRKKVFKEQVPEDKATFHRRFRAGFNGLVPLKDLRPLAESYFVPLEPEPEPGPETTGYAGRGDTRNEMLNHVSVGAPSGAMTNLRAHILQHEKSQMHDPVLSAILRTLGRLAEQALQRSPYSVVDKTTLPPSGNRQDYWHPAPYWWPDPRKADGLPYVRRDGERVPGTRMYEPDSDRYDRTRLQRVFDDSLTLGLAWSFFEEKRYAEAGARILERFFVDPNTSMKPHLKYAQVRMGHSSNKGAPAGLIEAKDMYFYLDAVRLFQDAGVLSEPVFQRFRNWLATYLKWLLTSDQGKAERAASNNHGTCYDLQVAAIASFLGDKDVVYETLARAQNRISEQFTPEGHQPQEIKRKSTAHYCCFNLQSWINLAELSSRWGVDLWEYETPTGAGLKNAAKWLISMKDKPWPYEQIDEFDSERILPICFAASEHLDGIEHAYKLLPCVYAVKSVFFPHDGIRPFWNLASYAATADSRKQMAAKGCEASLAGR